MGPSSTKGAHAAPIFGPCLLLPNGWMDQNATGCEGRARPRPHCVRWWPSSTQKGTVPLIFGPCVLWPNGRPSELLLGTCLFFCFSLRYLVIMLFDLIVSGLVFQFYAKRLAGKNISCFCTVGRETVTHLMKGITSANFCQLQTAPIFCLLM